MARMGAPNSIRPVSFGLGVTLVGLAICGAPALYAQGGDRVSSPVTPLLRYVPASAGVYVNVSHLGEVNEALHRVNAWQWLPLLLGAKASDQFPGDLQQALGKLVKTTAFPGERALMRSEVGIVASSVADLDHAVWLVRTPDSGAADRWFPENRRTAQADFGAARSFRMDDGLIVCARDEIVALARRWDGDSIVLSTMYLMRGRGGATLHDSPALRRARGYLPDRPLATVYVAGSHVSPDNARTPSGPGGAPHDDGEPAMGELVAALYEAEGGLDIAVRRASSWGADSPSIAPAAIERMLQLPRSTLLAVVHGVDWSELVRPQSDASTSGWFTRYLSFLFNVGGPNTGTPSPFDRLGSNVVFAWDQDFLHGRSAPQVALLLETEAGDYVAAQMRRAVSRMIELVGIVDSPAAAQEIRIEESTYLGNRIACAPLSGYARASSRPFARLLRDVAPCWTATGGWFVLTLGRNHLERILDAQRGLAPSLSVMREASSLRRRRADIRSAALVQGELAAEVLDEWLSGARGEDSFLTSGWWDDLTRQGAPVRGRVGIGMRTRQEPGVVVVGRVYSDTAATGLLEDGDRIIGVDGTLLTLDNPNADLRARIEQSQERPGPTLRVLRGGTIRDVVLPLNDAPSALPLPGMKPADAVRELASVFRSIPFASFVLGRSGEDHYAVRVNLKFSSETTAIQIPPE